VFVRGEKIEKRKGASFPSKKGGTSPAPTHQDQPENETLKGIGGEEAEKESGKRWEVAESLLEKAPSVAKPLQTRTPYRTGIVKNQKEGEDLERKPRKRRPPTTANPAKGKKNSAQQPPGTNQKPATISNRKKSLKSSGEDRGYTFPVLTFEGK